MNVLGNRGIFQRVDDTLGVNRADRNPSLRDQTLHQSPHNRGNSEKTNQPGEDMRRWAAYLLAVASALGFATLGVFALFGYSKHLSTVTMLTWRFAGAALVFTFWTLLAHQPWPKWRDLLVLVGMGAIGYAAMSWLFFVGNRIAPVGLVSGVLYTYPAIVAATLGALGWEPLTRQRLLALTGTGVGAVLVVVLGRGALQGGSDPLLGMLLGLGAAVVYAAYIVIGTPVLRRVTAPAASAVVMGAAAIVLFLFGMATRSLGPVSVTDAWIIIGLVGPATVLAVVGFFLAMQGIGSGQASIVSNVEPAGAMVLGWLVFGQVLTPGQLLGVVLVIGSAILLRWEPLASMDDGMRGQ